MPKPDEVRSSCSRPRSSSGQSSGSSDATRRVCVALSSVARAQLPPAQVALDAFERDAVLLDRLVQVGALLAGDGRLLRLPQPLARLDERPHLGRILVDELVERARRTEGFGSAATAAASSASPFCFSAFARSLRAAVNCDSGRPYSFCVSRTSGSAMAVLIHARLERCSDPRGRPGPARGLQRAAVGGDGRRAARHHLARRAHLDASVAGAR